MDNQGTFDPTDPNINKAMPRAPKANDDLRDVESEGNLFGIAQVSDERKPPQESLESYSVSEPAHRVKCVDGTPHEFSSTQFDLADAGYDRNQGSPIPAIQELLGKIDDEDLAEDGKEGNFHVTLLYGLHTRDAGDVHRVVREWLAARKDRPHVEATLGGVSLFPAMQSGKDHDVVKVEVESDDLQDLHRFLAERLEHTDKYPEYQPHVTLAYVKPGMGWLHVGAGLGVHKVRFHALTFSTPDGSKTVIDLAQESQAEEDKPPTVAVDLDGTLAEYDDWKGEDHFGAVRPGAREAMQAMRDMGCRIIIFTTRGATDKVRAWLEGNDIPFDSINRNDSQPTSVVFDVPDTASALFLERVTDLGCQVME